MGDKAQFGWKAGFKIKKNWKARPIKSKIDRDLHSAEMHFGQNLETFT